MPAAAAKRLQRARAELQWFERGGLKELSTQVEAVEAESDKGDLKRRKWALEEQIAVTPPTTAEGLALVATVQLMWHGEVAEDAQMLEARAGATLARHILAETPADVLQRAGLGERS